MKGLVTKGRDIVSHKKAAPPCPDVIPVRLRMIAMTSIIADKLAKKNSDHL